MKILATILSIYILTLTAIPCIDLPADNILQKIELSQSSRDNHQNETDNCSPFCTCDCCVAPVLPQNTIFEFSFVDFLKYNFSEYTSVLISSLFVSIWQPPKLN